MFKYLGFNLDLGSVGQDKGERIMEEKSKLTKGREGNKQGVCNRNYINAP